VVAYETVETLASAATDSDVTEDSGAEGPCVGAPASRAMSTLAASEEHPSESAIQVRSVFRAMPVRERESCRHERRRFGDAKRPKCPQSPFYENIRMDKFFNHGLPEHGLIHEIRARNPSVFECAFLAKGTALQGNDQGYKERANVRCCLLPTQARLSLRAKECSRNDCDAVFAAVGFVPRGDDYAAEVGVN
jgi:hypothetical protein